MYTRVDLRVSWKNGLIYIIGALNVDTLLFASVRHYFTFIDIWSRSNECGRNDDLWLSYLRRTLVQPAFYSQQHNHTRMTSVDPVYHSMEYSLRRNPVYFDRRNLLDRLNCLENIHHRLPSTESEQYWKRSSWYSPTQAPYLNMNPLGHWH